MSDYEFTLRFQLQDENDNPENYLDLLFEAGCDDALVGVGSLGAGSLGSISLNFTREASTASKAVTSAIQNVLSAIPSAILIELAPDLMNTTEIADIISDRFQKLTRQAVRKYATGQIARAKTRFPPAAISGSQPLWHLGEVLDWMVINEKISKPSVISEVNRLVETTQTIKIFNTAIQQNTDVPDDLLAAAKKIIISQTTHR